MAENLEKIPIILLVYYDFNIIKKCIDALLLIKNRLNIIIVENKSANTATRISPYITTLVQAGAISKYIIFEKNISNNALEVVFDCVDLDLNNEFLIVSDGDLLPENADWLDEQIEVLKFNPDVFTCALSLDLSNLPIKTMPNAQSWIDYGTDCEKYILASTGLTFLMFRTTDFKKFLRYRLKHPLLKFRDAVMRDYCKEILKKKWVRTKQSRAYHLTWDSYSEENNEYTKVKLLRSHEQIWNHFNYCRFQIKTEATTSFHVPYKKILTSPIYKFFWMLKKYKNYAISHKRRMTNYF